MEQDKNKTIGPDDMCMVIEDAEGMAFVKQFSLGEIDDFIQEARAVRLNIIRRSHEATMGRGGTRMLPLTLEKMIEEQYLAGIEVNEIAKNLGTTESKIGTVMRGRTNRRLSQKGVEKVFDLLNVGVSDSDIGREVGLSPSGVGYYAKKLHGGRRPAKRLAAHHKAEMRDMSKAGLSDSEIARQFNVYPSTVLHWKKRGWGDAPKDL